MELDPHCRNEQTQKDEVFCPVLPNYCPLHFDSQFSVLSFYSVGLSKFVILVHEDTKM